MAVIDKAIQKGLDAAEKQGFKIRSCRAGTLVENPKTGESTVVNVKEGRKHARQNAIHGLDSIDVVLPKGIRPPQKKVDRPDAPQRPESSKPVPRDPKDTPMKTDQGTISFVEQRYGAAVDKIVDDPSSPDLLLVAVREQADGEECVHNGRQGLKWVGNLWADVVRELWDDLPESMGHPQALRLYEDVIATLRGTKQLLAMPAATQDPSHVAWWVCPDEDTATAAPAKSSREALVVVKPDDEGTPNVNLYECPKCAFADASRHALTMHLNKVDGGVHPAEDDGPFPCPEQGCMSVRTTRLAYKAHMVRTHDKGGMTMCTECLDFWPDRATWGEHRATEHSKVATRRSPRRARVTHPAIEPPPAPTTPRAAETAPPIADPRPDGDSLAVADRVIAILEEYRDLKAADGEKDRKLADKDREIARLTRDNEALQATLNTIQAALGK